MVEKDYLEHFNDGDLQWLFFRKIRASRIENALSYYQRKRELSLGKKRGRIPFWVVDTRKNIKRIFEEVKARIDTFVGINDDREVNIFVDHTLQVGSGKYNHLKREIHVGYPQSKPNLAPPGSNLAIVLAHEYGHHIISQMVDQTQDTAFSIFDEGMAFGLERVAADLLAEQYPSLRFQDFALGATIDYLECAASPRVTNYTISNSLFAVLEAERGPDIYRQILHGEFKW